MALAISEMVTRLQNKWTNPRSRRFVACLLSLVCLASLSAGCGGNASKASTRNGAPSTGASEAKSHLTDATLRLSFTMNGNFLPFEVAKANGYYRHAGLNVKIGQGKGSVTTAETVANGTDTFGIVDAGTAALLISKGLPIKMVADYIQENPAALFYDSRRVHLSRPQDLKGSTIIQVPGSGASTLVGAILASNHIPHSDVKWISVSAGSVESFLASHPADLAVGLATEYPLYKKLDAHVKYVLFGRLGVNTYSQGVVASLQTIKDHPNEVRSFVAATNRGWAYTLQHKNNAAGFAKRAFPQAASPQVLAGEFAIVATELHTPQTKGEPLGWMSSEDWRQTVTVLHRYSGLAHVKPLNTYFTNSFIPKS